ncbi:hypothetical protein ACFVIM_22230 [Streptomyces sp. NPDC057638]|uniref:hypothetical protein n=1 Tax=Streptomyces sp. NPDC057638 TaxID=3346190 RepID=UPI0036741979
MISRARKALLVGVAGAVVVGTGLTTLAVADEAPSTTAVPASAAAMPVAVEDFVHPGAARLKAERNVTLKKGDGHITLVDCAVADDIMVDSRADGQPFCFDVTSKSGYLSLELPDSFAIWTEAHPVRATLTANGEKTVVNVPKNEHAAVGEGDGETGKKRSVLVELRVTG